ASLCPHIFRTNFRTIRAATRRWPPQLFGGPLASHAEWWFYWVGTTVVNATGRDTRKAARVAPRGLFVFCGPCALARSRLSLPVARVPGLASEDRRRYPRRNACRSSRLVRGRAFRSAPRRRRLVKKRCREDPR